MTLFLVLSAFLALAVLAGLLRPLWRGARGAAVGIGIVMLASTALLYRLVGTPQALDAAALRAPETLGEAIAQLEAELQRNPGQAEGWRLLAAVAGTGVAVGYGLAHERSWAAAVVGLLVVAAGHGAHRWVQAA